MYSDRVDGALITEGPADWQIIQQRMDGTADIVLKGTSSNAAGGRIGVRLVHEDTGAPATPLLDWQDVQAASDGTWQAVLVHVPAGGLYRIESRVAMPDGTTMRGDCRHFVGVGDIWIIAGQSNAAGRGLGSVSDPATLGVHLFAADGRWRLASHPLEDATGSRHAITTNGRFHGHSPWMAFARRLAAQRGYPIGLIPTARGGASLDEWSPALADGLYANMKAMVAGAGGRVAGVLWYQGESDTTPELAATYGERFRTLVAAMRKDLGPGLPVLTAQLCRTHGHEGDAVRNRAWDSIREAQRRAALELPSVSLVPTIDLPMSDGIHVSALGNITLGERFADVALAEVYLHDVAPVALTLAEVTRVSPKAIRVTFDRPAAGFTRIGGGSDFAVSDASGDVPVERLEINDAGFITLHLGREAGTPATVTCHAGCNPPVHLRDRDMRPLVAFSVEA